MHVRVLWFPAKAQRRQDELKVRQSALSCLPLCVFATLRETLSFCPATSSCARLPRGTENANDPFSNAHQSENRCAHVSTSTQNDRSTQTSGALVDCVPGAAA